MEKGTPRYTKTIGRRFLLPTSENTGIDSKRDVESNTALIEVQAKLLVHKYNTDCFNQKQLCKILNVGSSNVYKLMNNGQLIAKRIGRRKVVSAVALAKFLVEAKASA